MIGTETHPRPASNPYNHAPQSPDPACQQLTAVGSLVIAVDSTTLTANGAAATVTGYLYLVAPSANIVVGAVGGTSTEVFIVDDFLHSSRTKFTASPSAFSVDSTTITAK